MAYATEQTKGSVDGWWQVGLGLKATFHDQRFLTFRRVPYVKIKDTDDVLPVKEDPATPVMIHFVDYGNIETCPVEELKSLKKEFLKLPKQAFACRLTGVEPSNGNFSVAANEEFENIVIDKELRMTVMDVTESEKHSVHIVDLVEANSGNVVKEVKIADTLIRSGFVQKGKVALQRISAGNPVRNGRYKELTVQVDDDVDVVPTEVVSPGLFFCQLVENTAAIESLMDELGDMYKNSQPDSSLNLTVGMPCVALFSGDSLWYRAVVTGRGSGFVEVTYVDFGNTEKISTGDVRPLYEDFFQLPAQAFACSLSGVKPNGNGWSEEAKDTFLKLTVEKHLIAFVKHKDQGNVYYVELHDTISDRNNQINIAEALTERNLAVLQSSTQGNKTPIVSASSAARPNLVPKEKEHVFITVIENPSKFWCQLASQEEKLDELMVNLDAFYSGISGHDNVLSSPAVGMDCCAIYTEDEGWYRAVIEEVKGNKVKVRYIDYGNGEELPVSSVKHLDNQFKKYPAYAVQCSLSGAEPSGSEWDSNAIQMFENIVLEKTLEADFRVKEPPYEVNLISNGKSVSASLVEQGAAQHPSQAASPSQTRTAIQPFSEVNLKPGSSENVYITVIDSPDLIYCQLAKYETDLENGQFPGNLPVVSWAEMLTPKYNLKDRMKWMKQLMNEKP